MAETTRRRFNRGLLLAGGAAWVAPTVQSAFVPAAAASGGPQGCCAEAPVLVPEVQDTPPPGQPAGFTYVLWLRYLRSITGCIPPRSCLFTDRPELEIVAGPGELVTVIVGAGPAAVISRYVRIADSEPCATHTVRATWTVRSTQDCITFTSLPDCTAEFTSVDPDCA